MEAAERLVAGEPFEESDEDNEWFGRGIYFWEHAFKQAWWWARRNDRHPHPAVVGAVIRLGRCFDLVDPGNVPIFQEYHEALVAEHARAGVQPPTNIITDRRLDCAIFNYLYAYQERAGQAVDTARAVYYPTSPIRRAVPRSWISDQTHIQVCVRNPKSILALWHVREDGSYGKRADA
jgi:hypothetical protein